MGDALVGRNVIALDAGGKLLWRIPATGVILRDPDGSEGPEAYFGLELEEDGKTINVGSATGWTYEIDPETGKLSNSTFQR